MWGCMGECVWGVVCSTVSVVGGRKVGECVWREMSVCGREVGRCVCGGEVSVCGREVVEGVWGVVCSTVSMVGGRKVGECVWREISVCGREVVECVWRCVWRGGVWVGVCGGEVNVCGREVGECLGEEGE